MNQKQIYGLVGVIFSLFGVFAPVIKLPIIGTMNLMQLSETSSYIIMGFAALSFILILSNTCGLLAAMGVINVFIVGFALIECIERVNTAKETITNKLEGNIFAGIGTAIAKSISVEWGWIVLGIGAVALIVSGALKDKVDAAIESKAKSQELNI